MDFGLPRSLSVYTTTPKMLPMKRTLLRCFTLVAALVLTGGLTAQDWTQFLLNPNANFYDVQSSFNAEWGQREAQLAQARQDNAQGKFGNSNLQARTEMPNMKGGYKQYKRWEWYMEPRVYPSGDMSLPSTTWQRFQDYLNSNAAAMQQYQQGQGNQQSIGGPNNNSLLSSTWTFAGPTGAPTGGGAGRLNFVRFDPTNSATIYVGAPAGGLWKSTNSGGTWTSNTDFLTVIGVTDIAIDPTNTNTMYIATGDGDAGDTYSIGVLKSTDGGNTWNATGLTWTVNQGRVISRLLINPTNPQILIAATSNGIYRTINGGTSWTQVQTTNSFKDAEFKPGDPNTVYASGTRFWKSTNGGATWTNITSGLPANTSVDRLAIAVTEAPTGTAYVYVLAGSAANDGFYGFYRSTDSGTTFTQRSTTPNVLGWASAGNDTGGQGWYDLAVAASPTNRDVVLVGGVNIWRSTNGGTNWTINGHWTGTGAPYVHADIHDLVFLPGSGTTYFSANDGGLFRTTNSGGAWSDLSSNLCIAQMYRIGLSNSNASLWLTGHQDNGTNLKNGANYSETMGGDGMDCFIDRTNNNVMYAEYYNGSFNRSTNGGASWNGITTGLSGTAAWVTPWYQDPVTANTLWAGRTNVFRSTNQGTSWTQMGTLGGSGTIVDLRVAPSLASTIYAARSNNLYKSTNTGGTWTNITGTLPVASAAISRIDVEPGDPNTVIVTFSGYSAANKVFRTTNGGTSWTNISTGLPNLPVNCVRFMPGTANDAVYIGCDVGVYYMDNTFASWQPYFTSLPNVPVFDLEVYTTTGKLRAATFGRGVWEVDIYNPGTLAPIAEFTASQTLICPGTTVNFTDMSSFAPTSWSWTFQGGSPATSTAQNPTGITWSTPGTYSVTLTATNANGSDIETKTTYITVLGSQLPPLVEGFQAAFLPTGWTANNANGDGVFWTQATTGATSTQSAMFDNYNNDVAGAWDEMWAPRLNCGSYTTLDLTFDVAYARYNATYSDTLQVLVSTDCGATWTSVYLKGGTTLATAPDNTNAFVPTAAQWRNEAVSLNAYAGQSSVLVVFRNRGRYGNVVYIDNINITGTAAALPSATFTASASTVCAGTPVNFTSTSNGGPTSWTWTFPSGTPASATTQNATGVVWNTAGTYTVTHTATNAAGTGTTTQVITVNALPTVTTTTTGGTICSGNSTSITASGATTYNWMPGNLSGATQTVSPATTTTYTVTGTNANGCTNTATRTITVNPTPTVTTTATSTTICSGNSTTLTASGATTYNWMPGNLNGATQTVSPATTTTYTVTGTSAGCSATATRLITVNPTPTVTTTASNTTICSGSSTTLTASGATTYNWMPGNLNGATQTVSPTTTTTYTVTGTSAGCTATATRVITVNPTPTVTTTTTGATICSGNSTSITASGASTYNWMPGNLSGATQTVSPATTTTYTVTGTAANGCTNTATRTITVNPTPTVTTTATNTTICSGSSTTLTASGATTYNWMPGNLNGATQTVSPTTTTTYTVTGTSAGCTGTATRTITVNTTPNVTTTTTGGTICSGNSTSITASGASTYNWMPGNLSGTTVTVSPTTTTTYTVTGTAANGCTDPATRTITVNPTPTVTATSSSSSICTGNSVTLTGGGATTYNWMPGNLNGATQTVTPGSTTTYTMTGTSAGCSNTAQVTVVVGAPPTVTATATDATICSGGSTSLTGSGAATYTWMPGSLSGTTVTVSPTTTTTYTVTGSTGPGCNSTSLVTVTVSAPPTVTATAGSTTICNGGSTTLTGSGATNYTWMPGSLSGTTVTVSPSTTTTYTVTGSGNPGCTGTGTLTVTVNPSPTVTATSTGSTICDGASATLNASGATSYTWMPGNLTGSSVSVSPNATTTYTVTGDNGGCTDVDMVTITVNALPAVTASSSNASICAGGMITLTGAGASTYNWQPVNQNGTSITDTPASSMTYTVTGTDANGCENTAMVSVTVDPLPTISVTGNSIICPGDTITLTGNGGVTYAWQPGGQSTASITETPGASTTYTVTGTDANGCSNTATHVVTVDTPPATPTILVAGTTFTSSVTGASYQWFLNGNPIPGATGQSHVVTQTGVYTVEVYSANGCGSGQSAGMNDPLGTIDVTNVTVIHATPNPNDGHFVLSFSIASADNYIVEIYNALGQVVYSEALNSFHGDYRQDIDLSMYGRGLYTVRLRSAHNETVLKVITF